MAFDRKSLKASKTTSMKEQEQVAEQFSQNGNRRADFLSIPPGTSKWRLYPAHPAGISDSFFAMKSVVFLPQLVDKKDSAGKVIPGMKEEKRIPVFNSKAHGINIERDLVEEYIKFAKKVITENITDEKKRAEKLDALKHYQKGVNYKVSWVVYAHKISKDTKEFGRLEMTPSLKERLNDLCASEDPDEPIEMDPFTDPDTGMAIIVTYNKEAQPADKYKAKFPTQSNPVIPLTEEDVEKFLASEPLEKFFTGTFKRSDFDKQLSGLEIYDTNNAIGVFAYEEWSDVVVEISAQFPEEEEKGEEKSKAKAAGKVATTTAAPVKKTVVTKPKKEEDFLDDLTRPELKAFIKEEGFAIVVTPSKTDDILRDLIREQLAKKEEVEAVEVEEEEEESPLPGEEEENEEEDPLDKVFGKKNEIPAGKAKVEVAAAKPSWKDKLKKK